ncbi:MAG: TA system VapC family ribonuclease toxin [Prosthecobacter sp.]
MDTNILLYAFNEASPHHKPAYQWMASIMRNDNVAISEFVLAEFYGLLRNSAVLTHPLTASEAVEVVQTYRNHPSWRLIGFPAESRPLHDALWKRASGDTFAFRRLYDVRTALTMTAQGVTDFATVNLKDFEGAGFKRVWNPLI